MAACVLPASFFMGMAEMNGKVVGIERTLNSVPERLEWRVSSQSCNSMVVCPEASCLMSLNLAFPNYQMEQRLSAHSEVVWGIWLYHFIRKSLVCCLFLWCHIWSLPIVWSRKAPHCQVMHAIFHLQSQLRHISLKAPSPRLVQQAGGRNECVLLSAC